MPLICDRSQSRDFTEKNHGAPAIQFQQLGTQQVHIGVEGGSSRGGCSGIFRFPLKPSARIMLVLMGQ